MFWKREYQPDGPAADHVVQRGIPVASIGSEACILNKIAISYLEIKGIETLGKPAFPRKLVIRFRHGGSITFVGPRFGQKAVAEFASQVISLKTRLLNSVEQRWRNAVEFRLATDNSVRIDNFKLLDTGDIYEGDLLLTNIQASEFKIKREGGLIAIQHLHRSQGQHLKTTQFDLGLAASAIEDVISDRLVGLKAQGKAKGVDGFYERAALALISFAAIAGAWKPDGLRQRIANFCQKRDISFSRMQIDINQIDYAALALDKRFVRNTYNTIEYYCRSPRNLKQMRFNMLVDDLIEVAADGNRISSVSIYLIYEIALFQGLSMGSVPAALDRVMKLGNKPWIEVRDPRLDGPDPATMREEPPEPDLGANAQGFRFESKQSSEQAREPSGSRATEEQPVPRYWAFSVAAKEHFKFFGFIEAPGEVQLRATYKKLLKKHHPDQIHQTGTKEEIAAANEKMQEINRRRDWLLNELAEFWKWQKTQSEVQ